MTASFIQTADGQLISATGTLAKLHVGYASMSSKSRPGVFADTHLVGYPSPGGDVNLLLLNLATRAACADGIFGIEEGSVYRRFITERDGAQTMHYGTGENTDWNSAGAQPAVR